MCQNPAQHNIPFFRYICSVLLSTYSNTKPLSHYFMPWVLKCASELIKTQISRSNTKSFWFSKSEMGLKICTFNKFLNDTGQAPHFKTTVLCHSLHARKPQPKRTHANIQWLKKTESSNKCIWNIFLIWISQTGKAGPFNPPIRKRRQNWKGNFKAKGTPWKMHHIQAENRSVKKILITLWSKRNIDSWDA